jgi:hypothetical protein
MASYRLAVRHDTAANWTSADPVLAQGEFGYETDTGKIKIGDSATSWSSLAYFADDISNDYVDSHLNTDSASTGDFLSWDGSDYVWTIPNSGGAQTFTDLTATSSFTSPGIDDNATTTQLTIEDGSSVFNNDTKVSRAHRYGTAFSVENTSTGGKAWELRSTGVDNLLGTGDLQFNVDSNSSLTLKADRSAEFSGDLTASGNVGINEINPDEKLVVNTGSTGISKFQTAYSFQQRNAAIEIASTAPNAGNGSGYIAQGVAGGGIGIYQGGTYYGGGNYKLYGNATSLSGIQLEQGSIRFQAADGYSTGATPGNNERMRIDASGRVGIGEIDPTFKLNIKGEGSSASSIKLERTGSITGEGRVGYNYIGTFTDNDFNVYTNSIARMTIDSAGLVGINETDPQSTLDVTGDFRVTSGATRYVVDPTVAVSGYEATVSMTDSGLEHTLNTTSRGFVWSNGRGEHMRIDAAGDVMMQGSLEVNGSSFVHDTPNGRITLDRDVGINRLMSTTTGFAAYQTLETRASNFTWRLGTAAPAMTLNSTGSLLVGKDTANYILQGVEINPTGSGVFTTATETPLVTNRNGAGECAAFYLDDVKKGFITQPATGAPTFAAASDERLKDNVVDHESELANVMALRPTRWDWKDGSGAGEGFIAQEVEQTGWADLVGEDVDTGFKNLAGLGAVETRLIKAMQEQQAMIEALKAKVEALENA